MLKDARPTDGWVAIENVYPVVDCGRFPVKRVVGETLEVWADAFKPGHDRIAVVLQRSAPGGGWDETPMTLYGNDRWVGRISLATPGRVRYRVCAWTDRYGTLLEGVKKWAAAGEDVSSDRRALAELVVEAAESAEGAERTELRSEARRIGESKDPAEALAAASSDRVSALLRAHAPRPDAAWSAELAAVVDPPKAEFASWYELFPRSQGKVKGKGATFAECEPRIADVSAMGFDVIYLPPIHPIGRTHRRGPNNTPSSSPEDPGSPWAIGNDDGGHDAVNPDLGTIGDFQHFVQAAGRAGVDVALDLAFQCSPDHPYVKEHPEWFYHRDDGSIRYAENPPKKYYDIYPLAFDGPEWKPLWEELRRVTLFWVSKGVKTFRVDNPHTKPTGFWEWLIGSVKQEHPEVVFLAEAFTSPGPMKRLSKAGFTQSYTYFTWKNTKRELEEFVTEFVLSDVAEYYRGNLFTNTPDILHAYLQKGGKPAFKVRAALAATLSPLYGIYSGFELCESAPKEEGSEEYADSEKYQVKVRDWDAPGNIRGYIARLNGIRRENAALQRRRNLRFLQAEDDSVLFFARWNSDRTNVLAVAANLDPGSTREPQLTFPAEEFAGGPSCRMRDLGSGEVGQWEGGRTRVRLGPEEPVRIFRVDGR